MAAIINVYKPVGATPLEVIEQLKKTHPEYTNERLGYAGRLDPMAEGVLILLAGEENKKRKEYERFSKQYTFEVLFGIETDTYDIMGLITRYDTTASKFQPSQLATLTASYIGTSYQQYPPYSSPRVKGKPLFYWARNNLLHTIKIPSKHVHIDTFTLTKTSSIEAQTLLAYVQTRITKVHGSFRQKDILERWHQKLNKMENSFTVAEFKISCSSGLYVRSLAHDIGKKTHRGAIALSIKRTAVGTHMLSDSVHLMDTS